MPNIKDESTVKAIAREFVANGRNKGEALQAVGYSNAYAVDGGRGCAVVFSNVRVIEAIAELDAELSAKTEWDVAESERKLQEAYDTAKTCKQAPAMVSAVTAYNKMKGLDIDKGYNDDTKPLSDADKERYAAMARAENVRISKQESA